MVCSSHCYQLKGKGRESIETIEWEIDKCGLLTYATLNSNVVATVANWRGTYWCLINEKKHVGMLPWNWGATVSKSKTKDKRLLVQSGEGAGGYEVREGQGAPAFLVHVLQLIGTLCHRYPEVLIWLDSELSGASPAKLLTCCCC